MMDSAKCKGVKDTYGLGCKISKIELDTRKPILQSCKKKNRVQLSLG